MHLTTREAFLYCQQVMALGKSRASTTEKEEKQSRTTAAQLMTLIVTTMTQQNADRVTFGCVNTLHGLLKTRNNEDILLQHPRSFVGPNGAH